MITYQTEKLFGLLDEIKPLLVAHYKEIARNQDKVKLNPDYDKYRALDKAGMVHSVTARDEGKLIGYYISIVAPHLHYRDCIMAMNDVLFISPEYRKGFIAFKLLKYGEKTLKDRGVGVIHMNMKLANDFGILMERLGWIEIERIYEKVLF